MKSRKINFGKFLFSLLLAIGLFAVSPLTSISAETFTEEGVIDPTEPKGEPTADSVESSTDLETSEGYDGQILPPSKYDTPSYVSVSDGSSYTPVIGDIVTTSSTSSSGLTGHSGIVVSKDYILHFPGPGVQPSRISLSSWLSKYNDGHTWIHRVPGSTVRAQATSWAVKHYWNPSGSIYDSRTISTSYFISDYTFKTNPSYCSKIIWQGYYYGTGSTYVIANGRDNIIYPYRIKSGYYFATDYKPYQVAYWD